MKLGIAVLFAAAFAAAQTPDLAHQREVFNKLCGTCHTPESSVTQRRTRSEWQEEIARMIANGAKGTEDEFAATLDYLASQFGRPAGRPANSLLNGLGPDDKHVVDADASERGRKVWAAECIQCHGTQARGTDNGANLIRSDLVLHDRYGNQIGPFLKKGHKMQSGKSSATLGDAEIQDLSHFIHDRVYDTLRGSPIFHPQDVLTGNAKDGAAYFSGKCAGCHSPTGDLAHVAAKYDPPTLQGRFLNPRPLGNGGRRGGRGGGNPNAPRVTLTVSTPSGESVTGTPVFFDDFNVALRDGEGNYRSWKRVAGLKVVRNDPYAAHDELLTEYSDKNMHDILAYLETLK